MDWLIGISVTFVYLVIGTCIAGVRYRILKGEYSEWDAPTLVVFWPIYLLVVVLETNIAPIIYAVGRVITVPFRWLYCKITEQQFKF